MRARGTQEELVWTVEWTTEDGDRYADVLVELDGETIRLQCDDADLEPDQEWVEGELAYYLEPAEIECEGYWTRGGYWVA